MISYTCILHNFYSHRVFFTELGDSIFTPVLLTADRRNIFMKLISFFALKCHWDIYHYIIQCPFYEDPWGTISFLPQYQEELCFSWQLVCIFK